MDTVNMIQVLELLLGKLTTELEQTDGRVQWVGKGGGGGGGGWLRVVCSSSTKLWGRNKLDVVKFTTAKYFRVKIVEHESIPSVARKVKRRAKG